MKLYKEKLDQLNFVEKVLDAYSIPKVESIQTEIGYDGHSNYGKIRDLLGQGFRVVVAVNNHDWSYAEFGNESCETTFILERPLSYEERLKLYRKYLKENEKEDRYLNNYFMGAKT